MYTIEEHPHLLLNALEKGIPIYYKRQGWRYDRWWMRTMRWLLSLEKRHLRALAKGFIALLDHWEHHPLTFTSQGILIENDRHVCELYLAIGGKLLRELHHAKKIPPALMSSLQRRLLALQYRAKRDVESLMDPYLFSHLEELAAQWKRQQFIFKNHPTLTALDLQRLGKVHHYPDFARLIEEHPFIREQFFQWILGTHNPAEVFIEFPAMAELLNECQLASHLGYYDGRFLRISFRAIQTGELHQKDLECLFEGMQASEWHSILNGKSSVKLKKECTLSIEQIFDDFRNKDYAWGKVWVFETGISNWHAGKLARYNGRMGRYDAIQLTDCWWEKLPAMKWISLAEAEALFPYLDLGNGEFWIGRNVATRRSLGMKIEGNHAYREIYIPCVKEGQNGYRIYTFCLYPTSFPYDWRECFRFVASTWEGTITCPDPTAFCSKRQRAGMAFTMSLKEAEKVMSDLKWDIQQGRMGNLAYQILIHNCAKWSTCWRSVLGPEKVPTMLYRASFDRSEPPGIWGFLFKFVKRLPDGGKDCVLSWFFFALGGSSSRRIVTKGGRAIDVSLLNPRLKPWLQGRYYGIPSVIFETVHTDHR